MDRGEGRCSHYGFCCAIDDAVDAAHCPVPFHARIITNYNESESKIRCAIDLQNSAGHGIESMLNAKLEQKKNLSQSVGTDIILFGLLRQPFNSN